MTKRERAPTGRSHMLFCFCLRIDLKSCPKAVTLDVPSMSLREVLCSKKVLNVVPSRVG